jgi:hypothetical protein
MVVFAPPRNWRTGRLGTGSDRQIVMVGIQHGYRVVIRVVKTGRRLSADDFTREFTAGTKLTLDETVEYALAIDLAPAEME